MDAGESLGDALTNTVDYCINHNIMREFLLEHEQEVPEMYSLRYNEQAAREAALDDGRIEGFTQVAIDMLKDRKPVEEIIKYTQLPMKRIQELAAGIQ